MDLIPFSPQSTMSRMSYSSNKHAMYDLGAETALTRLSPAGAHLYLINNMHALCNVLDNILNTIGGDRPVSVCGHAEKSCFLISFLVDDSRMQVVNLL